MSLPIIAIGTVGTLALFLALRRMSRALGGHPLTNPVALACLALIAGAHAAGVPSRVLADAAWPLKWAMGPAIVALAVPVSAGWAAFAGRRAALLTTVALGSLVGVVTAVFAAHALGLAPLLVQALSSKSTTSPFSIAAMTALGGPVALAAAVSVVTGIIGAIALPPLLAALRLADDRTLGLAVGQASHVAGTDALLRTRPAAARVSGLALAIAGPATTFWLVLLWPWVRH